MHQDQTRRPILAGLAAAGFAVALAGGLLVVDRQEANAGHGSALAAVTNADGSPKKGYDPARQPQRPLKAAAGRAPALPPQARVDGSVGANKDSKGVNAGTKKQVRAGKPAPKAKPSDVLTATTANGGCRPEYGGRGQCLPFVPPSHAAHPDHGMDDAWTCTELRSLMPKGIPVREPGIDPLGLDTDGDGTACGRGDV